MKKVLTLAFIILSLSLSHALAQAPQRDSLKEKQFEQELSKINPRMVPVFQAATAAMDSSNLLLADSLYLKVVTAAPEFSHAYRRISAIRSELGDTTAMYYSQKAVQLKRSWENLIQLASCYVYFSENQDSILMGISLADEAIQLSEGKEADVYLAKGQLAMKVGDQILFETVANQMLTKFSKNPFSYYYGAISAADKGKFKLARERISKAERLGLNKAIVKKFVNFLDENYPDSMESGGDAGFLRKFFFVVLAWAGGLFLLFLLGAILSAITVRSVARPYRTDEEMAAATSIRKFYRILINIGGVYYYLSLPIVLLMVLVLGVLIMYMFVALGRIPIKLMALIGIGMLVTLFSTLKSVFTRMNSEDPGRQLKPEEAPALFQLTREVAAKLKTRPIDEIRITPGTELAVYEKGNWRQKVNDTGKRVLIIGTAVLKDFRIEDFKAVLAHEYGHFSNRDTAGGGLALRVQKDMYEYFVSLVQNGQDGFWNISYWFLRLYDFIFRRISLGATRLQEVLADRVAAQSYGGNAFRGGLTHVIRRTVEFQTSADQEINIAKRDKRPFNNLYDLPLSNENDIDQQMNKIINSETTADDSHPSPRDRFKLIEGLNETPRAEQGPMVTELFADYPKLTAEMTGVLEKMFEGYGVEEAEEE